MNTRKHQAIRSIAVTQRVAIGMAIVAIFAIAIIALPLAGCSSDSDDAKTATIRLSLGSTDSHTATVTGNLTDAEWEGVANKIKTAIEGRYTYYEDLGGDAAMGRFVTVFNRSVTIIVEKTPSGYTKWKTTTDGKTLYLAFGELNNNLGETCGTAITKMATNTADNG